MAGTAIQRQPNQYTNLQTGDNGVLRAQKAFLEQFGALGNVLNAAEAAGMSRQTHYDWLDSDPTYADRFEQAKKAFGDRIHRKFTQAILEAEPREILLHPVAAIAELKRWFVEYRDSGPSVTVNIANVGTLAEAKAAVRLVTAAQEDAG